MAGLRKGADPYMHISLNDELLMNNSEMISVREYVESLVCAANEKAKLRAESIEKAMQAAADALTIRLEHSNNLIAKMADQQRESDERMDKQNAEFARKGDLDSLKEQVVLLREARADTGGRRAGLEPLTAILMVAIAAVVAAVVAKLF